MFMNLPEWIQEQLLIIPVTNYFSFHFIVILIRNYIYCALCNTRTIVVDYVKINIIKCKFKKCDFPFNNGWHIFWQFYACTFCISLIRRNDKTICRERFIVIKICILVGWSKNAYYECLIYHIWYILATWSILL